MGRQRVAEQLRRTAPLLERLGLSYPASARQRSHAQEMTDALEGVRVAWQRDEATLLPDTSVPDRPLAIEELFALAAVAGFSLRRATDGFVRSRDIALDALRLYRRVVLANAALTSELAGLHIKRVDKSRADLAYLRFHVPRELLFYLRNHVPPDSDRPNDPDAHLSTAQAGALRRELFDCLVAAHEDIERFLTSGHLNAVAVQHKRAEFFARRIIVAASIPEAVTPPDGAVAFGLSRENLDLASEQINGFIRSKGARSDTAAYHPSVIAAALLADSATGNYDALRDVVSRIASDHATPLTDRVNLSVTTLNLTQNPDDAITRVEDLLHTIESQQTGSAAARSLSHVWRELVHALARIAEARPERVSELAGVVAGFGADRSRWNLHHPHVWLLQGPPHVALIDSAEEVRVVALPNLTTDTLVRLVDLHAEEHDVSNPLGALRRELSDQLQPLGRQLAASLTPVTAYAFGHLKHLPLPALTGQGAVLAARPGIRMLARREPWPRENDIATRTDRVFVLDNELAQARRLAPTGATVIRFNSDEANGTDAELAMSALGSLCTGAGETFFFGHGYVNQFEHEKVGLVTRHHGGGAFFAPASDFANADMRTTSLAVILACGAGQANVFVDSAPSIAQAFCLAGCDTVIAPTWPIVATDAADFLERLLARLDHGESARAAWAAIVAQDPNRFCSIALFGD